MKKAMLITMIITMGLVLTGCTDELSDLVNDEITNNEIEVEEYNTETTELDLTSWGSASAFEDVSFTLEEMLVYAIQDEFTAKSEYDMIMAEFDVTNPFSKIIESEDTHIGLLLPLFEAYKYVVPVDDSANHLFEVTSLKEAFEIGVIAEVNNIAMYNLFLTQDLPDDIYDVFVSLRDASENHLDAFQKNLDKY